MPDYEKSFCRKLRGRVLIQYRRSKCSAFKRRLTVLPLESISSTMPVWSADRSDLDFDGYGMVRTLHQDFPRADVEDKRELEFLNRRCRLLRLLHIVGRRNPPHTCRLSQDVLAPRELI